MNQTLRGDGKAGANSEPPTAFFSQEELARRRQTSRRLAWCLGATALALYLIGFLLKR